MLLLGMWSRKHQAILGHLTVNLVFAETECVAQLCRYTSSTALLLIAKFFFGEFDYVFTK